MVLQLCSSGFPIEGPPSSFFLRIAVRSIWPCESFPGWKCTAFVWVFFWLLTRWTSGGTLWWNQAGLSAIQCIRNSCIKIVSFFLFAHHHVVTLVLLQIVCFLIIKVLHRISFSGRNISFFLACHFWIISPHAPACMRKLLFVAMDLLVGWALNALLRGTPRPSGAVGSYAHSIISDQSSNLVALQHTLSAVHTVHMGFFQGLGRDIIPQGWVSFFCEFREKESVRNRSWVRPIHPLHCQDSVWLTAHVIVLLLDC